MGVEAGELYRSTRRWFSQCEKPPPLINPAPSAH